MSVTINGNTGIEVSSAITTTNGGTGLTSPGTSGNVLTSDGYQWSSQPNVPVGSLIYFAGSNAPVGYLACPTVQTDVYRSSYPALFEAIGTTWGAGDGSTTFGIPWFPVDYAPVQSNNNVGSKSVGVVLAHTHGIPNNGGSGSTFGYGLTAGQSAAIQTIGQTPASGSANLAAGVRVLICIKI